MPHIWRIPDTGIVSGRFVQEGAGRVNSGIPRQLDCLRCVLVDFYAIIATICPPDSESTVPSPHIENPVKSVLFLAQKIPKQSDCPDWLPALQFPQSLSCFSS